MGVMDQMKLRSKAGKLGSDAVKTVKGSGNVATRGTGLGPARGLRDILLEAKREVIGS